MSDLGEDVGRLVLWEVARGLRFVALEFFFRGYLLFALEERFGNHAIAVSAMPYAVVHFGKPFPEALGAIISGVIGVAEVIDSVADSGIGMTPAWFTFNGM